MPDGHTPLAISDLNRLLDEVEVLHESLRDRFVACATAISDGSADPAECGGISRDVHSIKSLVGFAPELGLVDLCHAFEEALPSAARRPDRVQLLGEAVGIIGRVIATARIEGRAAGDRSASDLAAELNDAVDWIVLRDGDGEWEADVPRGLRTALTGPGKAALARAAGTGEGIFEVRRELGPNDPFTLAWAALAPSGMILGRTAECGPDDSLLVRYLVICNHEPTVPTDATVTRLPVRLRRSRSEMRLAIDSETDRRCSQIIESGGRVLIAGVTLDEGEPPSEALRLFEEVSSFGQILLSAPDSVGMDDRGFRVLLSTDRSADEIATRLQREAPDAVVHIRDYVLARDPRRGIPTDGIDRELDQLVRATAERRGVQVRADVTVAPEAAVLPSEIRNALHHMVRNAVDHGIEAPEHRLATGKPVVGAVTIRITRVGTDLIISVRDDGRGIDTREGERSRQVPEDLLERLCASGYSTRDVADELSGRGQGMGIVREAALAAGGEFEIQTVSGWGMLQEIRLPWYGRDNQ